MGEEIDDSDRVGCNLSGADCYRCADIVCYWYCGYCGYPSRAGAEWYRSLHEDVYRIEFIRPSGGAALYSGG